MKLSSQDVEKMVSRALGGLPDHPAPKSLETRVLAEIGRRAQLPWWSKSYAYWPASIRGSFFLLSAVAAAAVVGALFAAAGSAPASRAVASLMIENSKWFSLLRSLNAIGQEVTGALSRSIPPVWLYGTIAVVVTCYATVVGMGAAAYRFFLNRNRHQTSLTSP